MTGRDAIRVLYFGAANLGRPTSGLDLACRAHFEELADDPRLAVTAISVSPTLPDHDHPARRPARVFAGDMLAARSAGRRWRLKLGLLARGGVPFHSGLVSAPARAALRDALATGPDVLVADNVGVLGNVALPSLLRLRRGGRCRILVIAHDASADVLRDRASLQGSRGRAAALRLHAAHLQLYETAVFALADRVVFLSDHDRGRFPWLPAGKTQTLCPVLDGAVPEAASEARGAYLLFAGTPAFFANAAALDWITQRLAPELMALRPDLPILLVGRGTDGLRPGGPANVIRLGFVEAEELARLVAGATGVLSPIVHGSGIKIKVLEALAAGSAVFATAASLRGYEFMRLQPVLDIADPAGSARRIAAAINEPGRLAEARREVRARWDAFRRERQGKLAEAVHRLGAERGGG